MGNYRFKLSELIPNAWFYKLRDMTKSRKHSPFPPPPTPPTATAPTPRPSRRSSYHSRPLKSAPSSSIRRRATVGSKSSAPNHPTSSALCCRENPLLDFSTTSGDTTATVTGSFSPEFRSDKVLLPDDSSNSSCHSPCSSVSSDLSRPATFTQPQQLELRPIITKPANKPTTGRKTVVNSPAGVRLRLRSPRISTRKSVSSNAKRSVVAAATSSSRRSRAVVKTSVDPRRDFKESMEEMIAENNIRASKDLEELLACYLCLNSDEYHAVIINVFKQLWLDLNLQQSK